MGEGVLPTIDYTEILRPKRVPFFQGGGINNKRVGKAVI